MGSNWEPRTQAHKQGFRLLGSGASRQQQGAAVCEDSGQKDGDMPENMHPLHSAFCRSNCRSKPALKVKWLMPWELFLIHRQSTKNAFRSKLRMFGTSSN